MVFDTSLDIVLCLFYQEIFSLVTIILYSWLLRKNSVKNLISTLWVRNYTEPCNHIVLFNSQNDKCNYLYFFCYHKWENCNSERLGDLGKEMAAHASVLAWRIPGMGEPGGLLSMGSHVCIGGGNGNPLQCSCLENPSDGGASWAAIYGVAQSRTRLKRLSSINVASYS